MARKLWVAVDCCCHTNPKVMDLAERLHLDIDAAVGKLCRLWSWAKLAENEDGLIGRLPASELAAIMRWTRKPQILMDAMLDVGFLDRDEEGHLAIHDWYELNGKSAEKARRDRERKC